MTHMNNPKSGNDLTIKTDPHLLACVDKRRLSDRQWQTNLLEGMISTRHLFAANDRMQARIARHMGMKYEAERFDQMADEHEDAIKAAREKQAELARVRQ